MPLHGQAEPAVLGYGKGPAFFVPFHPEPAEIIMFTDKIAALLIKPAAGAFHQTARIQAFHFLTGLRRVELPPAFIKKHPAYNGGVIVKKPDCFGCLLFPDPAAG